MQSLLEIISQLHGIPSGDRFSPGPTIYARIPWSTQTYAVVLAGNDVPDGVMTESGYHYLLEVDLACEVIEVWRAWRGGIKPTPEEATLAIIYYAEHDAYMPTE